MGVPPDVNAVWDELEADMRVITSWLVDWWPGLEDGMSWPDNDDHRVVEAARRVKAFLEGVG